MRALFSRKRINYDGSQLRSGWLGRTFGLRPDAEGAIVAFLGGCDVRPEFVVDLEEVESGEAIRAALMLHFIAEFPERDLEKVVLRQRLLAAIVRDELAQRALRRRITRRGDDLYDGKYKLSISIATLSPKSALLHFAVDIDPTGAPVPARGLPDYGVDPREFARSVLKAYVSETSSIRRATGKVRFVK